MATAKRIVTAMERRSLKTAGPFFTPDQIDPAILEVIPYARSGRSITVELTTAEFSCVCPFSGLPDFAVVTISYVPRRFLVEMKSLKYYFCAFRNVKVYNEHAVGKIADDLARILKPRRLTVTAAFTSRGGIVNKVTASVEAAR